MFVNLMMMKTRQMELRPLTDLEQEILEYIKVNPGRTSEDIVNVFSSLPDEHGDANERRRERYAAIEALVSEGHVRYDKHNFSLRFFEQTL